MVGKAVLHNDLLHLKWFGLGGDQTSLEAEAVAFSAFSFKEIRLLKGKLLNINVSVIFQLRCTGLGEVNSVSSREVHHISYHALASH